jgi:hypothetical protein
MFSEIIPSLSGKDLYIYITPENPDWASDDSQVDMIIHSGGKKFSLPLFDAQESSRLVSGLHHFINSESLVLSWSAKDIYSFLKGRTGIPLEFRGNIYDLQIICSYFGYPKNRPETFRDAVSIIKKAFAEPEWILFKKFHNEVYKPLFSEVVPSMETVCLVDNKRRILVHPSYVIDGQANGRLKAFKNGRASYNPHTMGFSEKSSLKPSRYDQSFVYFDFRNMEVCVLSWLSGDKNLAKIINSGSDPYREIWKIISGENPTDSQRLVCKNMFLPVVFGLGASSLSKKIGVSEKISKKIIDSFVKSFPTAFDWINRQSNLDSCMALDVFGRKRIFNQGEFYKSRNFFIQSPASMICLKKLVSLYMSLSEMADICFHVHDGYCLVCDRSSIDRVIDIGSEILESEDDLFPGLHLRVSCKFGLNLENLETPRKEKVS